MTLASCIWVGQVPKCFSEDTKYLRINKLLMVCYSDHKAELASLILTHILASSLLRYHDVKLHSVHKVAASTRYHSCFHP
jgi:hypothetical protein